MNIQCKFEKSTNQSSQDINIFALYSGVLIKFFKVYQLFILIHSI